MQVLAIEEYGIRCLLQVALHSGPGPLTAPELARREGLGPEYVARIMGILRAGGLVRSTRGAAGGYRLARPAAQIDLWEVVRVLGGQMFPARFCDCHPGRRRQCVRSEDCAIRALWAKVEDAIRGALERVTLADLRQDEASMSAWLGSLEPLQVERT